MVHADACKPRLLIYERGDVELPCKTFVLQCFGINPQIDPVLEYGKTVFSTGLSGTLGELTTSWRWERIDAAGGGGLYHGTVNLDNG